MVPENIYSPTPKEGYWKFKGEGRAQKPKWGV